jgi:hypothetical protein
MKLILNLTEEDIDRLRKLVPKMIDDYGNNCWGIISREMNCGLNAEQCCYIWRNKYDPLYKYGAWTDEELNLLADCANDPDMSDTLLNKASVKIPWRNRYNIKKEISRQCSMARKDPRCREEPRALRAEEPIAHLSKDEIRRFVYIVEEEMAREVVGSNGVWSRVAERMNCSLSNDQCLYLWRYKHDHVYNNGPWTVTERALLAGVVNEEGVLRGSIDELVEQFDSRSRFKVAKSINQLIYKRVNK